VLCLKETGFLEQKLKMSRQFGKKEDDNELVANIIGSIVFAILIILYCVIRG
tara:strand:+ start:95 stop:250 length:156 start_codon:yes stop_codon:yes gene_type:complete